jgi:glutaminase
MTCSELAHSFFEGKKEGKQILTKSQVKEIECFDADLWFYDESGEFTYKVGLPAKWNWRWYCGFIPKILW